MRSRRVFTPGSRSFCRLAAAAAFAWMPPAGARLPAVDWQLAGETAHARVEDTFAGRRVAGDGIVTAFTRSTLVADLDERRRQRIDELRAAGLPARGYERSLRQVRRTEYDRARGLARTLTVVDHDEAGRVLAWADAASSDLDWSPVAAASIGGRTLAVLCADPPSEAR